MSVEKVLRPALNNPTRSSLQYMQYLTCETSVIVFAIRAIREGVRKTSSLLAEWPPSTLPSPPAALKSPPQQNKSLLLSRNNTLISPPKQRISCSCCSDSAACSEQQEENKEEEVREEGRGGSRPRSSSPAPPAAAWPVPQLRPWGCSCCRDHPQPWCAFPCGHSLQPPPGSTCRVTAGRVCTTHTFFTGGWKDPVSFYQLECTIHSHGSTRHWEFSVTPVSPSPSHWHLKPPH